MIDIEPCPHCGEKMIGDADFMAHPKNDCILSEWEFDKPNVAAWNRRATPQAPTPAAAEGQAEEEISCDQCIELAEELQKEWMRKAIAETRTAASLFDVGGFRAGMETACDEIETRMALGGDTLLAAAEGQYDAKLIADLYEFTRYAACSQRSNTGDFLDGLFEQIEALQARCHAAAPLPRQAAVREVQADQRKTQAEIALQALVDQAQELDMGYGKAGRGVQLVHAVPDGTALVPREATESMMHAAEDVPAPRPYGAVWRAMIAAAPVYAPGEPEQ